MAEEYRSTCKDCKADFGYSEASIHAGATRGLTRPERCPACRRIHSKESRSIGIPQIKIVPRGKRKPDDELVPGRLGKISHPKREHIKVDIEGKLGRPESLIDFGITDDDMRQLIKTLQSYQVAVVVGPTGSGKSTFLPYRLMVPPEDDDIPADVFTRYGQIVVTQPRIQATRNVARFVARDLHGSSLGAGFEVGFRHSGSPASDWRNKLVYITDGTLINWIVSGQISNLSVIMIDEAHERSLNIDIIIGLLKQLLPRYPHLRLIIASATINADLFQKFYGGPDRAALLRFRGIKQYQVNAYFPPGDMRLIENRKVPGKMAAKIIDILEAIAGGQKAEGDILGFLPGEKEINKCVESVQAGIIQSPSLRGRGINVYPLFTSLPQEAQDLALSKKTWVVRDKVLSFIHNFSGTQDKDRLLVLMLDRKSALEAKKLVSDELEAQNLDDWFTVLGQPDGSTGSLPKQIVFATHADTGLINCLRSDHEEITDRRVIVATNVAETSLTVDGIVYVVDSGLIKESRWDPTVSANSLVPIFHSRAGCRQRWGRAGRVRDGEAHMLYTDIQFEDEDFFQAHTTPEIQRSALEQVVLKAKTAGIDDIVKFDWIERPPEKEMQRASETLMQMGALDEDGDLTALGMELQGYTADVPIANLLLAADQFSCGVEMATLAALLSVRLRGGLLKWDPRWDFVTRSSVEKIHHAFAKACHDDLELYFKIYSVWAEASDEDQRTALGRLFFFGCDVIAERVVPSRNTFMEMLSIAKKACEDRTIAFSMLDRLRFVLAVNLPEKHLFEVEEGKIRCLGGHDDLPIVVDENSTFSAGQPSFFLACGRRVEQKGEDRRLSLSCLVNFKKEWLEFRTKGFLPQAAEISRIMQAGHNEETRIKTRLRLFYDVFYPCLSTWQIVESEQGVLRLGRLLSYPEPLRPVLKEGSLDTVEDITQSPPGDVSPFAGIESKSEIPIPLASDEDYEKAKIDLVPDCVEDEDRGEIIEESGAISETPEPGLLHLSDYNLARQYQPEICLEGNGEGNICVVVAHDFSDTKNPSVRVRRFDSENDRTPLSVLEPGGVYKARAIGSIGDDGKEKALVVCLLKTGDAEFALDAADLSFSGRYILADMLAGKEFDVKAVERQGTLRLTRLPLMDERLQSYLLSHQGQPIPCRLVEKDGPDFYFIIEEQEKIGILEAAHMWLPPNILEKEGDRYTIGQSYNLFLSSRNPYGEANEAIPVPPPQLPPMVEDMKHELGIFWNERQRSLHTKKPMTMGLRMQLEELSNAHEYKVAIARLYRHSNRIRAWSDNKKWYLEKDDAVEHEFFRQDQDLVPAYNKGDRVSGRISEIRDDSVFVVLDRGGKGRVSKRHLCWIGEDLLDPREVVSVGQVVKATVLGEEKADQGMSIGQRRTLIDLSLRDPDNFPIHQYDRYTPGSEFMAEIIHVDDRKKFAIVELGRGVTGIMVARNISRYFIKRLTDHLTVRQQVNVVVKKRIIDPFKLDRPVNILLALKDDPVLEEFKRRLKTYQLGGVYPGQVCRIDDSKDFALVALEEGVIGLLPKFEISYGKVSRVSDHLKLHQEIQVKIKQIDFDPEDTERPFRIRLSHKDVFSLKKEIPQGEMGLLIGPKWVTINHLQAQSGCRINVGKEGSFVTILGNTEEGVEKTSKMIDDCVATPTGHRERNFRSDRMKAEIIIPGGKAFLKLVGMGGKTVRELRIRSECKIFCEEGLVRVEGQSPENIRKALALIRELIPEARMRENG